MNGSLRTLWTRRACLVLVTGIMATTEYIHAQDYVQAPATSPACSGGSCRASQPGQASCPNGRCSTGPWFPTLGHLFPTTMGTRQYQATGRPGYQVAAPSRIVLPPPPKHPSGPQNRESPYYSESDLKPAPSSRTAAPFRAAVRPQTNDSPYYE